MAPLGRLPFYGVLAVIFAGLAQPAEFNQLFQTYSRADHGGCQAYLGKDGLFDDWHQEVYDMVEAAIRGLNEYLNVKEVQMAAKSFFGIAPNGEDVPELLNSDTGDIYGIFGQVESFLDGAGTPRKTVKLPWLFCDSTFLTRKYTTSQAQDSEGEYITAPNLTPILIGNEYRAQLTGGKIPFWSEDMHAYIFDSPDQGDAYCASVASQGGLAVTVDMQHNDLDPEDERMARTAIILCPSAFTDSKSQDTLRSLPIKAKTKLQAVQPKSLTLLHEIFHALFSESYFDSGEKEDYGVVPCMKRASGDFEGRDPVRNPDNWAYFSLAMYYLVNPDSNGKTWDFSTGSARAVRVSI